MRKTRSLTANRTTLSYREMDDDTWEATKASELIRISGLEGILPEVKTTYPYAFLSVDEICIEVSLSDDEKRMYRIRHANDFALLGDRIAEDRKALEAVDEAEGTF